jgi:hypothetical protein
MGSIRRYLSQEGIGVWDYKVDRDYCLINQSEVLDQPVLVGPLPDS